MPVIHDLIRDLHKFSLEHMGDETQRFELTPFEAGIIVRAFEHYMFKRAREIFNEND